METDRIDAIEALLVRAEAAHGEYEATELNGVHDTEWPRWYAAYAVEHGIGQRFGLDVTVDRLAALLAGSFAEFERTNPTPSEGWAPYVARRLAEEL